MNTVDCRNIEKDTEANKNYRQVVKTVDGMQLVLMSLNVGETIPCEVHKGVGAQFIRIESGTGKLTTNDKKVCRLSNGTSLLIPNGIKHCIENTSKTRAMKLYSIYTPPQHVANHRDVRQPNDEEEEEEEEEEKKDKPRSAKRPKKIAIAPRKSIQKKQTHTMKLRK